MHMDVGPRIIIQFDNGLFITETVFWAVIVAVCMIVFAYFATKNLKSVPKGVQIICELIVEVVYKFVKENMGKHNMSFAPFMGTLFFFLIFCNMLGLFGQRPATADVNFTFALGITVFVLIQFNAIRSRGIGGYLKHFAKPFPFMIPINLLEEVIFPVSLSFRLFGNILAGVIIMELWMYGMAGYSARAGLPIPLLQAVTPLPINAFFDIFEPFLQAFVFSMLTMAFISKAIVVRNHE